MPARFTTRADGDLAGEALRARADLGPAIAWMDQLHGARVQVVDGPTGAAAPECDALVTVAAGLVLAVRVADCVPVLLMAPGVVAAAHAGRRGLAAGVVPDTVAAMRRLGAAPEQIRARLGPAICGGCYEVPAAMRADVAAVAPAARCTTRRGTPGLDLRAGIAAQLADEGVRASVIDAACTAGDPAYYSYRRDATARRFAGLVWRE